MNEKTEDFLRKFADNQQKDATKEANAPTLMEAGLKEYQAFGKSLQDAVSKFNSNPISSQTGISLSLEGPEHSYGDTLYLLRLRGGKINREGHALLFFLRSAPDFNSAQLEVQTWESHLVISALKENLSRYAPHQRPNKLKTRVYNPVLTESAYGWVLGTKDSGTLTMITQLIDNLVHELVTHNMGVTGS